MTLMLDVSKDVDDYPSFLINNDNVDCHDSCSHSDNENFQSAQYFSHLKTLEFDDDIALSWKKATVLTEFCTSSDSNASAGNVTTFSDEYFELEVEEPQFNYVGSKIVKVPSRHETPVTICIANTIGAVKSRRIFRILLDSGSTLSLIKRSRLPQKCCN